MGQLLSPSDQDDPLAGIVSQADMLSIFSPPDEEVRREVTDRVIPQGLLIDPDRLQVTTHSRRHSDGVGPAGNDQVVTSKDPAIWRHAHSEIGSRSLTGAGPPRCASIRLHVRASRLGGHVQRTERDSVATWLGRVAPLPTGLSGLYSAWAR